MRVLYLVERFWPLLGGVEVISARLLPMLRDRGHDILVLTTREQDDLPEEDDFDGIPVRRFDLVDPIKERDLDRLVATRGRVNALVADFEPEILHAVFTGPSVFFARVPRPARRIVSFHGSWPMITPDPGGLLERTLLHADWVTACSQAALRDLRGMVPGVEGHSSAILNGLDPPDLEPPPLPFDPPVLMCSGRVVDEKGFDLAIAALPRILEAWPGARLWLAGDGLLLEELREQAAALGVAGHVEMPGWISPERTAELVAQSTIVLVPSRLEGFGLVALEAALMARPVVATTVGGLPEVVVDGTTGVLVGPEDPAALADAALDLLARPARARALGEAARARALERFTATAHADAWDALYRHVAGDRG